jgi:hypothetical protein
VPVKTLLANLVNIGSSSQARLDNLLKLNPLCKQQQECVGWGADAFSGTFAKFPLLNLTYSDEDKSYHGMREPLELEVKPILVPPSHYVVDTQVFSYVSDYTKYIDKTFRDPQPAQHTNGVYGRTYPDVFATFFQRKDDRAITVSTTSKALLITHIKPDTSINLDTDANRAIQSLPPSSTGQWNKYAPVFYLFFEMYGSAMVTSGSSGGKLEQYSRWPTYTAHLPDPDKKKPVPDRTDYFVTNAQLHFTNVTGLGGYYDDIDPVYSNITLIEWACFGGNAKLCAGIGSGSGTAIDDWTASIASAPLLLSYQISYLTDFLAGLVDDDILASLEGAIQEHVIEQQQQWQNTSKCPLTCNGFGTCGPKSEVCDCNCGAPMSKPNHSTFAGRACAACVHVTATFTCTTDYPAECTNHPSETKGPMAISPRGESAGIVTSGSSGSCYCSGHDWPIGSFLAHAGFERGGSTPNVGAKGECSKSSAYNGNDATYHCECCANFVL